jgi:hypothetical protein
MKDEKVKKLANKKLKEILDNDFYYLKFILKTNTAGL